MKILSADVEPVMEHDDTVTSYFMYEKESLRSETEGSYLEFINEFELKPGVSIQPHSHNSHEFYYVIKGSGIMRVDDSTRDFRPGDLEQIEPDAPHSLRAGPDGIRCFAFAASFQKPGETFTAATFPDWP